MARQPKTLIEHIYARNRSFRETWRTSQFIFQWATEMYMRGGAITMAEYVEGWEGIDSRATSFRRQESFRKTFGDDADPNVLSGEVLRLIRPQLIELENAGHKAQREKIGQLLKETPLMEIAL